MTTNKTEGLSAIPIKNPPIKYPYRIPGAIILLNPENDMEFHATRSTGKSSQIVIAKTKNSKLYMTTGEKHPQLVAHLSTLNEVPDRAAALHDELERLAKSITQKPLRALQGRFLLKDETTSVVYNQKSGMIDVRLRIDLNATPNAEKALIAKMQAVNVCLHTSAPFLTRHKN